VSIAQKRDRPLGPAVRRGKNHAGEKISDIVGSAERLSERRFTFRMLREWLSLRRLGTDIPSINDFDPRSFDGEWNSICLVFLGVGSDNALTSAIFEFIGKEFTDEVPSCPPGSSISVAPPGSKLACAILPLAEMIRKRRPIVAQGLLQNENGVVKFRTICLPFSDQLGCQRYALGAFSGATFTSSFVPKPLRVSKSVLLSFDHVSESWVEL